MKTLIIVSILSFITLSSISGTYAANANINHTYVGQYDLCVSGDSECEIKEIISNNVGNPEYVAYTCETQDCADKTYSYTIVTRNGKQINTTVYSTPFRAILSQGVLTFFQYGTVVSGFWKGATLVEVIHSYQADPSPEACFTNTGITDFRSKSTLTITKGDNLIACSGHYIDYFHPGLKS